MGNLGCFQFGFVLANVVMSISLLGTSVYDNECHGSLVYMTYSLDKLGGPTVKTFCLFFVCFYYCTC